MASYLKVYCFSMILISISWIMVHPGGGGGGYSSRFWVGVCDPGLQMGGPRFRKDLQPK